MSDKGEYRGVYVALTDDPDFQDLSACARLCFFVLKLKLGRAGIAVFYPETLPRQTGFAAKECEAALDELRASGWLLSERTVFWLRNGLRFDPSDPLRVPMQRRGIEQHLAALPKFRIVLEMARYYGLTEPFTRPSGEGQERDTLLRKTEDGEGKTEDSLPSGEAPARETAKRNGNGRRGPLSHFVPDTWSPTEAHRKKAAELAVNLEAEAQAFRLHEFNTPHSDWGRAFSKWLLRAPGFTNGNGSAASHANGGGETTADRLRREGDARDRREALDAAKRAQLNTWGLEVERRLNTASAEVRERIEAAAELSVGTARVPEVVRSRALRTARLRLYGAEIGSPMPEVGQ